MTIYHLIHQTYCNGSIGDFSLPKTVGHFTDRGMSEAARDADIKNRLALGDPELMTTPDDYRITPIHVIDDPQVSADVADCIAQIEASLKGLLHMRSNSGPVVRACINEVMKQLSTIRTLTHTDGGSH